MKGDEKNITKQDNLVNFPEDKNDLMYEDSLKVGYTSRDARTRIKEQIGTTGQEYEIVVEKSAMRRGGG